MTGRDDKRMLLRAKGRTQACDGILRSHFGRRPSTAGSEALRKLRLSKQKAVAVRQSRPRSSRLKVAAAAAVAAALIIALLYAFSGTGEREVPSTPGAKAKQQTGPGDGSRVVNGMPEPPPGFRKRGRPPVKTPVIKHDVAKTPLIPQDTEPESPKVPERKEEPEKPVVLAQIGEITGEVKVKRRDSEEWLGLEAGVLFSILPGDTLTTDSLGLVRLDLDGGDCLYVNSDAEIAIGEEEDELLIRMEKGEIYLEKETAEGAIAIDTGFGRVRCPGGRFGLKMSGKDECLLQVLSGKVECSESGKGYQREYGGQTCARLRRGRRYEEGTKLDSEDSIQWARKMRSKRRGQRPGWRHRPGRPGGTPRPGRGGPRPSKSSMGRFFKKLVEEFDELDANGDGKLSGEEVKFPIEDAWNRIIEKFDTDGDGALSLEECKAMQEKMKERKSPGKQGRGDHQEKDAGTGDGK